MPDERRDDWKHSVDEHLVNLTTAQKVTDRQLEDCERILTRLDRVISGDPQADLSGIVEQMHQIQRDLNKINAVIFVDSTGKRGLLHEVEALTSGERTASERWKFATAVTVAIISMVGLLLTNWNRVLGFLNQGTIPFEQSETPKHRKPRR